MAYKPLYHTSLKMKELSPQQLKKLERLAKVLDNGDVELLKQIDELEDKLDTEIQAVQSAVTDALSIAEQTKKMQGEQGVQGERGEKGDKGENGKDGVDGTNGKDGENGKDGRDGVDGKDAVIDDALIARIADMAESLIELPDFASLITMEPEAIRNSLELLPDGEKLAQEAIEGLPERLKELENRPVQVIGGGVSKNAVLKLIEENTTGVASTFETVSKNLDASGATLNYTGDNLTSIVYANGITKTLSYTGDNLTSVILSGSTPSGIDLTKTLSYTGDNLTGVVYS